MKKLLSIVLTTVMVLSLTACGGNGGVQPETTPSTSSNKNTAPTDNSTESTEGTQNETTNDGNILVAYFSFPMDEGVDAVSTASRTVYDDGSLGNTNYAAHLIQKATGGELFTIEPEEGHYQTDDFKAMATFARDEIDNGERPAIRSQIENFDDYDVVFVGYPIWWYDMPAIMYSFFDTYDFSGKTIIPFTTHGGSRLSGTVEIIQNLEPNAVVETNAFTVSREAVANAREDVEEWINSLDLEQRKGSSPSSEVSSGTVADSNELPFPLGTKIDSDAFTGNAYIAPMIALDDVYHFPATNHIAFEPGARSAWHKHGGMVILVTGGVGYYQEEGKPAQIIRKGDVIESAEGVRHWHGAAPDSWFSQIVIFDSAYVSEDGASEEPVTDAEYNTLETEEYAGRTITPENAFMFQKAEEALASDTFNGPAYVSSIIDEGNVADSPGLHYVVFGKGVINNWHIHEGGQILIATDGIGYHQIEGEPVQVMYPGDVALCPPGEKHWHGGSADTEFAHIAVNTNPELTGLEWFDRISDEEYQNLSTKKSSEMENQE